MMAAVPPKKRILVTGPPGVGKTTLIIRALEKLRSAHPQLKVQGFYTREVRHAGERTGFEVVTVDGCTSVLATSTLTRLKKILGSSLLMRWERWSYSVHHFYQLFYVFLTQTSQFWHPYQSQNLVVIYLKVLRQTSKTETEDCKQESKELARMCYNLHSVFLRKFWSQR